MTRRKPVSLGYAAYGRYKVNGIAVIECLGCGVREPVKTRAHKENFRLKHNATCHADGGTGSEPTPAHGSAISQLARKVCPTCDAHYRDVERALQAAYQMVFKAVSEADTA